MSLRRDMRFVQGNLDAGPTSLTPEGRCLYGELVDKFKLAKRAYSDLRLARKHLVELQSEELDWGLLSVTGGDADAQAQLNVCMKSQDLVLQEVRWCGRALQEVLRDCRRIIREMERLGKSRSIRRSWWLKPREMAHTQH